MGLSAFNKSILLFKLLENQAVRQSETVTVASSRLDCLNEAVEKHYGLIIINCPVRLLKNRNGVLELCDYLNSNPITKQTPVFASMDLPHRGLAKKMQEAGVTYMEIRGPDRPIDPERINRLVQNGDVSIRIDKVLDRLCPHLTYSPIDAQCELISCRAYRNRMILGGKRLHEVCEAEGHVHCEYFLNPKVATA